MSHSSTSSCGPGQVTRRNTGFGGPQLPVAPLICWRDTLDEEWPSDIMWATLLYFYTSRYIIGKKGETKKRLETETRTSISIPKPGMEGEIGEF